MVKTALITGGASGIGKACVEKMAREGYGVVIADVNLAGAEALAAQLTAEGLFTWMWAARKKWRPALIK